MHILAQASDLDVWRKTGKRASPVMREGAGLKHKAGGQSYARGWRDQWRERAQAVGSLHE